MGSIGERLNVLRDILGGVGSACNYCFHVLRCEKAHRPVHAIRAVRN
jgi:hypothetical protein